KIGVIDLPTFDVVGIHGEVAQVLESLLSQHVKAVVLDLRDNGGGLVTEARLVASMFIVRAVLVNGDTASSAEIVTGALQDHHRAVIVGTRTYGKGVFQEIQPLSNGGAVVVTGGQYFLPDGKNLGAGGLRRGAGITPNVIVTAGPTANSDPQLQAALAILAAKARGAAVRQSSRRCSSGAAASRSRASCSRARRPAPGSRPSAL